MVAFRFSVAALEAQRVVQLTFERDFEPGTRAPGSWIDGEVAVSTFTISATLPNEPQMSRSETSKA